MPALHHGQGMGLVFLYSLDCLFSVIQALLLQHSWGLAEVMLCMEGEFEGVFWRDIAENRGIHPDILSWYFKLRREGAWYLSPGTSLISSHCKDLEAFSKLQKSLLCLSQNIIWKLFLTSCPDQRAFWKIYGKTIVNQFNSGRNE